MDNVAAKLVITLFATAFVVHSFSPLKRNEIIGIWVVAAFFTAIALYERAFQ